jgi:hypothetical protein
MRPQRALLSGLSRSTRSRVDCRTSEAAKVLIANPPAYNEGMPVRHAAFLAALLVSWSVRLAAQTHTLPILQPEQLMERGANLGSDAAEALEAQLEKSPEDVAARAQLLGFYYYQWMKPGEAAARAARRRHILWLIEHHPESPVLALAEVPIEETGNSLADPEGYKLARELWLKQREARPNDAYLRGNLARFFQMTDKELAEKALLEAKTLQPGNFEWEWRLGYLYGMGVLGVDALGLNGQPTSVDPIAATGPFAIASRKALAAASSGTMLSVAAQILWRYGTMLAPTQKGKLEWLDEAQKLIERAKSLDQRNPGWTQYLRQIEASRQETLSPAPKQGK